MKRFANAVWKGTGKEGLGHLSSQSAALNNVPYTWKSRFEEGVGTNPEELVGAAHAGCFSMKLSFNIEKAGFKSESIETRCEILFDKEQDKIGESHLSVKAKVPGISKEKFEELVQHAVANCPISKSLNVKVTYDASLEQ
jgi:lipoyl-dependent peroxiredoxin